MAPAHRFEPPARGSRRGSVRSSSTPSLTSEPRPAWQGPLDFDSSSSTAGSDAGRRQSRREEKRESSVYNFVHTHGYGGHVPLTDRNKAKIGKTFNAMEWQGKNEPLPDDKERWRQEVVQYEQERRLPKKIPRSDEAAGLGKDTRVDRPHWTEWEPDVVSPSSSASVASGASGVSRSQSQPSLQQGRDEAARHRRSSTYGFTHMDGYLGHKPVVPRNKLKQGKTFGRADKMTESERWGRSQAGAAPAVGQLDRLGHHVDVSQKDPRPPRKEFKSIGAVPGMKMKDGQCTPPRTAKKVMAQHKPTQIIW